MTPQEQLERKIKLISIDLMDAQIEAEQLRDAIIRRGEKP